MKLPRCPASWLGQSRAICSGEAGTRLRAMDERASTAPNLSQSVCTFAFPWSRQRPFSLV
jgi:hypothetical protein